MSSDPINIGMQRSILVLLGCIDYGLAPMTDNVAAFEEPPEFLAEVDTDDDDASDDDPTGSVTVPESVTLRGTVTVIPTTTDGSGVTVESEFADGTFPFGAVWVSAFVKDPATGGPSFLAQTAILMPTPGANAWELDLPTDAQPPVYFHAMLDEDGDGIIETAARSGIWRDGLRLYGEGAYTPDDDLVEHIDLYISVPDEHGGGDSGGFTPPPPMIRLSGDATVAETAGERCAALLFGGDWFGPYGSAAFYASGTPLWEVILHGGQGDMPLGAVCDQNVNLILDPADAWGTWVDDGSPRNPLYVGDSDVAGLHLEIPSEGAFTTAEPIVGIGGTVTLPAGASADAVLHVVALRGQLLPDGEIDVAAFAHEYGWQHAAVADVDEAFDYSLPVPAWKQAHVWALLDLDGDGLLNESGEPSVSVGACDTEASCAGLDATLTP